jgi:hypothetical protein
MVIALHLLSPLGEARIRGEIKRGSPNGLLSAEDENEDDDEAFS